MNPILTIIVPIYNVETYLENCIMSILNQTFNDFELILVNDGSTDKSLDICYSYEALDKRVKVINKENGGVSSARNLGIENAQGKYIAFVDPDDDVDINMYNELIPKIEEVNCDIIVCSFTYIDLIKKVNRRQNLWYKTGCIITKEEIKNEIFKKLLNFEESYGLYSPVNKIYKKELFYKFNIRFDERKYHGEDARLNLIMLTKVQSIYFLDKVFYNYYIRERKSLTRVIRKDLYEYITDNRNFHEYLCNKYNYQYLISRGRKHYLNGTFEYIISVGKSKFTLKEKKNIINRIITDKVFIDCLRSYECPNRFYIFLKKACEDKSVCTVIFLSKLLLYKENTDYFIESLRINKFNRLKQFSE